MIRPVKTYSYISTHFGATPDPGVFGKHAGNDYACPVGTPIYAPISGTVTVSTDGPLAGGQVEITGDKIHRTLHMSRQDVSVGQKVVEGQQVGLSGDTGTKTTGPHCHWDVRKLGTAWDHSFSDYYDSEVLLKQGENMLDDNGITNMWLMALRRKPVQADLDYWRGQPYDKLQAMLMNTKEYGNVNAQLANSQPNATQLKPGLYKV